MEEPEKFGLASKCNKALGAFKMVRHPRKGVTNGIGQIEIQVGVGECRRFFGGLGKEEKIFTAS